MPLEYVNLPEWSGQTKRCTALWRLRKNGREVLCELFTHPIGREIRVTVDGEMVRTEAGRNGTALMDLPLTWKTQFQERRGWQQIHPC